MRRIFIAGGLLALVSSLSLWAMDEAPRELTPASPKLNIEIDKNFVGLVQSRVVARTGSNPDDLSEIIDVAVVYEAGKPKTFKISRPSGETLEITITNNVVKSLED